MNDELSESHWPGLQEAIDEVAYRRGSLPEPLVAADVHCRRSYLVCPACKERLLANPLGRGWPDPGKSEAET